MTSSTHSSRIMNEGFSAVELLIALFIGALFLLGGYQIWGFVQRNGVEADYLAKASNLAYAELQNYSAPLNCMTTSAETFDIGTGATDAGLPNNTTASVETTCPITTSSPNTLVRLKITITYTVAGEQRSVSHAAIRSI